MSEGTEHCTEVWDIALQGRIQNGSVRVDTHEPQRFSVHDVYNKTSVFAEIDSQFGPH